MMLMLPRSNIGCKTAETASCGHSTSAQWTARLVLLMRNATEVANPVLGSPR
jgi:hypothetical protein